MIGASRPFFKSDGDPRKRARAVHRSKILSPIVINMTLGLGAAAIHVINLSEKDRSLP